MPSDVTLGTYDRTKVRIVCRACGLEKEFLTGDLLAEYGSRISMTHLLTLIAKCERRDDPTHSGCLVHFHLQSHYKKKTVPPL